MSISPDELDAISQEVRATFLKEDAPGYIESLRAGLQYSYQDADYFSLLSALHSLKGGAGIAQFHSLHKLAHKLEDLIQSLQNQSCTEQELAWSLFIRAIEEIDNVFKLDQELAISPELLQTLEEFSQASSKSVKESVKFRFNLSNTITVASQVGKRIRGVTQKAVAKFKRAVDFDNSESYTQPGDVGGETLTELRSESLHNQPSTTENSGVSPPPARPQATVAAPKIGKILRLPLQQLDQMLELTEELITYNECQNIQQQQLSQVNLRLEVLAPQFQRIQSSLKAFYDNSIPPPTLDSNTFTTLCDDLRTLQELISLFKENNADINLATRNLTENQKATRQNLEKLYSALIRSRLVPFKKLAQTFLPYLSGAEKS